MAKRTGILQEFWLFMKENKAYWMAPIIIVFVLLGFLIAFAPAYAPGIYTLF